MSSEKKSEFQNENNKIKARASSENKNRDSFDLKKEKNEKKLYSQSDSKDKHSRRKTHRIKTVSYTHLPSKSSLLLKLYISSNPEYFLCAGLVIVLEFITRYKIYVSLTNCKI